MAGGSSKLLRTHPLLLLDALLCSREGSSEAPYTCVGKRRWTWEEVAFPPWEQSSTARQNNSACVCRPRWSGIVQGSEVLSRSTRAAATKIQEPGGGGRGLMTNVIFPSCGSWKPKLKVLAGLVSGESPRCGSWTAMFSLCPRMVEGGERALWSLLCEGPGPSCEGSSPSDLVPSQRPTS